MAKWGSCDFKKLQELQKRMDKLQQLDIDKFCRECAKVLAARLLAKVIKRTPVGDYPSSTGIKGGTLRRGWTAKSEREAELTAVFGGGSGIKKYAESLSITKTGHVYQIEIINPVSYGLYVEFGHRTANHSGWVPGQFMLTISEQELDSQAPQVIEKLLIKYLGEIFNG
jgi:hypothetical protein